MRNTLSLVLLAAGSLSAASVGVDGKLGAEWTGFTPVSVGFDAGAPIHNFGSPGINNQTTAYSIYTRGDSQFFYALMLAPVGFDPSGFTFANLYLDTNPISGSGSDLGIEVTNDRAFIPGVPGFFPSLSSQGFEFATFLGDGSNGPGIELALPWTYLQTDPQAIGFPKLPDGAVRLNLSQTFGYSVIGGQANFGSNRLGLVNAPAAVPEPGTLGLMSLVIVVGLTVRRRG